MIRVLFETKKIKGPIQNKKLLKVITVSKQFIESLTLKTFVNLRDLFEIPKS